jgi:hypothetical protein
VSSLTSPVRSHNSRLSFCCSDGSSTRSMKPSRFSEMAVLSKREAAAIRRASRIHHALLKRAHEHRFPDPNLQPTIFKEELPFPFVMYPRVSGLFFAFQEEENAEPIFCECSRYPIRQRIELLNRQAKRLGITYSLFSQVGVPDCVTPRMNNVDATSIEVRLSALRFAPGLCHECNRVLPKLRIAFQCMVGRLLK